MSIKKLLAYVSSFLFGGVPSVIELWVTEKDTIERTDELFKQRMDVIKMQDDDEDAD